MHLEFMFLEKKMHMTPHRMEMGKYFKIYADLWNEYNFDKNFFSFFKIIWCMEKSGHFYSKIVPKWKGYWLAKLQKGKNLIREDEKYHKTTSIKSQDIFADDPAANTKVLCASKIKKDRLITNASCNKRSIWYWKPEKTN